ncbi:nucleotide exchange factor GrpE, partial [Candidatus Saccharibacteria bacterium RIFCSPLOWO2_02_FULL_46_7]
DLASHNYVKGIQVLAKKFENLLTSLGVKRIKTVGQHFNPHLHEAVHMEDGDGKHEVISEELQAGYKIGDEVVRPAMVKVKRGKK